MLGKKFACIGYFGCIYAFVYFVGSAIFGAVTEHVGDYQLLRLVLFTAIAVLITWLGFTLLRLHDRRLMAEYRSCHASHQPFLRQHKGFAAELLVALIALSVIAVFLAFTEKQIITTGASLTNRQLAIALVPIGFPLFLLLDLASWGIVCSVFRAKSQ